VSDLLEPIAVVGIAGRFPSASDIDEFWHNLRTGRECITFPSDEELLANGVRPALLTDPTYVKAFAEPPGLDLFDAGFFGMTPREAKLCDPHFRQFLEIAHMAVENAGHDPTKLDAVAVYGSTGRGVSHLQQIHDKPDLMAGVFNFPDYLSMMVSYKLDFTGPSMTVLTACSSSLLTVHLAVQALRNGECDLALAGGVEIELPRGHGYRWAPGGPFSRDGHCRPFDASASGTIFGSGVGVVLLKRLSDALADNDVVHGIIRGIAANNDGSDKLGFSAPSVSGQRAAAIEAISLSECGSEGITYVEAHGTGTPLGDPVEFAALSEAYQETAADGEPPTAYFGLGSVKGNVGHLGHAAGIASLLKVILALEHEELPPSINIERPNPKLELGTSPFYLNDRPRPWPRVPGRPRRAGVNALGFGGTNVHALIEEAPVRPPAPAADRPQIIVWSARTEAARGAYEPVLADHLEQADDSAFAAAVATLQEGRTAHPVRAALVAEDAAAAVAALREGRRIIRSNRANRARKMAFLFPGQGAQHARMAWGLYGAERTFTDALEQCFDLFAAEGRSLRDEWRGATEDEAVADTTLAQPLVFAVEIALARMWRSWGLEPDAVLGHSVGELVAATITGVIALPDAIRLVAARAAATAEAPPGAMLAISASVSEMPDLPAEVTVAAINGPRQIVLSGPADEVDRFATVLADRGVPCRPVRTSHAFHHPMMATAASRFAAAFTDITLRPPAIRMYSAATGTVLTEDDALRPSFWADQLTSPVLFDRAVAALLEDGEWTLLEVGPERTLTAPVRARPEVTSGRHVTLPTLPRRQVAPEEQWTAVATTVASLWSNGHDVDWTAIRQGKPPWRAPLPGYRYERESHWYDEEFATSAEATAEERPDRASAAEPPAPVIGPFTTVTWIERPRSAAHRRDAGGRAALALLPGDQEASLPLVLALQQAGARIIPVHPGGEYREGDARFVVRPGEPADLRRVLDAVHERGESIDLLVHAWGFGTWDPATADNVEAQLDHSFVSLLGLIQHGTRPLLPAVTVLTSRTVDVSGGDPLDPVKATMYGLARTLMLEMPQVNCRLIDVGPGVTEDDLVAELISGGTGVVALRGDRRWMPAERPAEPVPFVGAGLRRDGVYLITGGLGGLGLEVAQGLARTGLRSKLALIGRSASEDDPYVRDRLAVLRSLGAEVRVFAADVADARALRRVLDTVTARFGPVNGVLHLAGVSGGGVLQLRDRREAAAMLRPKVLGTLVLERLFADRPPLDFFVSFGSRAGIDGLAGAGDYAAANAFLDAHARRSALARGRALSIGWPAWNTVGMVAREDTDGPSPARRWSTVLTQDYPFLDEHRVTGENSALLPSTAHLDLVARAYREEIAPDPVAPFRLEEVAFRRPLVVRGPHRVEVVLEPEDGRWRFTIRSASDPDGQDWTVHVTGRIAEVDDDPGTVDLDAVSGALPDTREPAPLNGPGRLFRLGPRWRNVREVRVSTDTMEKLVSLELPASFASDLDVHPLHPSLLDSATSYARNFGEPFHLPYVYGSVTVYGPLPARLYSHIRRKPSASGVIVADMRLVGEDGRDIVTISDYTMRLIDGPDFVGSLDNRATEAPKAQPRAESERGLAPDVGVRLLLDLLKSHTPRQVGVLPYRGGRPVLLPGVPALWVSDTPGVPHARVAGTSEYDRAAAPRPPASREAAPQEAAPMGDAAAEARMSAAERGRIEDRLRGLWTMVLGIERIEDDDDFFDLGGNSLSAIDLMAGIREEFAVDPGIAALFDYPTLSALAGALRAQGVLD
jgi:phthiocerol/phenolphthiocerol synthesis type-I polyketide synthase E